MSLLLSQFHFMHSCWFCPPPDHHPVLRPHPRRHPPGHRRGHQRPRAAPLQHVSRLSCFSSLSVHLYYCAFLYVCCDLCVQLWVVSDVRDHACRTFSLLHVCLSACMSAFFLSQFTSTGMSIWLSVYLLVCLSWFFLYIQPLCILRCFCLGLHGKSYVLNSFIVLSSFIDQ